jgi:actin-related protein
MRACRFLSNNLQPFKREKEYEFRRGTSRVKQHPKIIFQPNASGASYYATCNMSTHHQTTIVVELGCSRIKVGLAGESKPRHVMSGVDDGLLKIDDGMCTSSCTWNHFYNYLSKSSSSSGDALSAKITTVYEWEKTLYPLFSYVLTSILFIQRPSRHRMLILMNDIFTPRNLREALLRVLLDYLNLGGVLLVNGGCFGSIQYLLEGMNLSISPTTTTRQPKASLVIDIGTNEARIAVSAPGSSFLVETYNVVSAGYQAFLRHALTLYQEEEDIDANDWRTNATLEDVNAIVDAWIIASNNDQSSSSSTTTVSVELPSLMKQANEQSESSESASNTVQQLSVLPLVEAFHQVYLDYSQTTSLTYAILSSVLASPIDLRKAALQNVVLVGGGAVALRSFGKGLEVELENAIKAACGVSTDNETNNTKEEEEKKDDDLKVSSIARGRFQGLRAAVDSSLHHDNDEHSGVNIKYPDPFAPDLAHWLSGSIMGKLRLSNEDWIHLESSSAGSVRGERLRR